MRYDFQRQQFTAEVETKLGNESAFTLVRAHHVCHPLIFLYGSKGVKKILLPVLPIEVLPSKMTFPRSQFYRSVYIDINEFYQVLRKFFKL